MAENVVRADVVKGVSVRSGLRHVAAAFLGVGLVALSGAPAIAQKHLV